MDLATALVKLTADIQTQLPIALLSAFSDVFSQHKRRIFNKGEAADNTKIGNYSTKPAWFGVDSFAVKSAFKPAKGRKSVKLNDGYKGLRELQGFQVEKVDLQYSNALFISYQYQPKGNGSIDVGFSDRENYKKARGNEKRFKKTIFYLSPPDIALLQSEVLIQLNRLLESRTA